MDKRRICGYEQFVSYNSDHITLVSFSNNKEITPESFLNCNYVHNLHCSPLKVPILYLIYSGLKRREQSILCGSPMSQIINALCVFYLFYQNYC